ncbi:precorrin-6A synthase (deacetylating) [Sphingomonas azotifigens]|uniref:precorrin-6A synthase (deacetylating) n=1 Tax=Sphingomonas azotifigens TaxID=330920 RepID=UPI000A0616D7|nr:precorrin-6A synthase (deacetylating) [Sphingomonas azotifigens]
MIALHLIGIGTGNPRHLTGEAVDALNAADLILVPRKENARDLADLRQTICAAVLTRDVPIASFAMPVRAGEGDYLQAVHDWHDAIATAWRTAIVRHLPGGGKVALLVWGDPSLYDSSLRIAARFAGAGVRVVPGITSIQALTAAHAIPLNPLAGPVTITTGRLLRAHGWPNGADSLVVMLDAGGAFEALDPQGVTIWWGAYLGMPEQALAHGPLAEAGPKILATRAALRARHGWIMDVYLLRKDPR